TNVLLSAALKDRDPEKVILFIVSHSDFTWVASVEIVAEYRDVLARKKFGLPEEIKQRWFNVLDSIIEIVPIEFSVKFPRDQKDAKFIGCAISANADFLISGDKDFSEAKKMLSTSILSVAQFQKLVCEKLS
ncbi:MAG: putative toxin-antitoxin system toxin component, PIN family, partial [Limisphaerales bacterium]